MSLISKLTVAAAIIGGTITAARFGWRRNRLLSIANYIDGDYGQKQKIKKNMERVSQEQKNVLHSMFTENDIRQLNDYRQYSISMNTSNDMKYVKEENGKRILEGIKTCFDGAKDGVVDPEVKVNLIRYHDGDVPINYDNTCIMLEPSVFDFEEDCPSLFVIQAHLQKHGIRLNWNKFHRPNAFHVTIRYNMYCNIFDIY
jgi:hypothetical protein